MLDDFTLDKPYAKRIGLVTRHWSGKHHRVVMGINLITYGHKSHNHGVDGWQSDHSL